MVVIFYLYSPGYHEQLSKILSFSCGVVELMHAIDIKVMQLTTILVV